MFLSALLAHGSLAVHGERGRGERVRERSLEIASLPALSEDAEGL